MPVTIRKDDPGVAEEAAAIDKRIRSENLAAQERAVKRERASRTPAEIKEAYEAAMAEKRREQK